MKDTKQFYNDIISNRELLNVCVGKKAEEIVATLKGMGYEFDMDEFKKLVESNRNKLTPEQTKAIVGGFDLSGAGLDTLIGLN